MCVTGLSSVSFSLTELNLTGTLQNQSLTGLRLTGLYKSLNLTGLSLVRLNLTGTQSSQAQSGQAKVAPIMRLTGALCNTMVHSMML